MKKMFLLFVFALSGTATFAQSTARTTTEPVTPSPVLNVSNVPVADSKAEASPAQKACNHDSKAAACCASKQAGASSKADGTPAKCSKGEACCASKASGKTCDHSALQNATPSPARSCSHDHGPGHSHDGAATPKQ